MGENLQNEAIYVAVNQDVRESKKTLKWTLKNFHVKKICLLHVHIPFSLTSSSSWLGESMSNAIQESQVNVSYDSLYKYRDFCTNKGVDEEDVDISLISGYNVGEGIVELIYQNNIRKLVMGGAADPYYSRGMSITWRKTKYVSQHAPHSCKMWFICKGKLIKTKEGSFGISNPSNIFVGFYDYVEEPDEGRRNDEHESTKPPNEHLRGILEIDVPPKKRRMELVKSKTTSSICPPQDYICPISMEIMMNPHVAVDGFTYEKEEIKTWLRGRNKNSPITGAKLENHNLIPNYTLRSLIQDWLQKHPDYIIDK